MQDGAGMTSPLLLRVTRRLAVEQEETTAVTYLSNLSNSWSPPPPLAPLLLLLLLRLLLLLLRLLLLLLLLDVSICLQSFNKFIAPIGNR